MNEEERRILQEQLDAEETYEQFIERRQKELEASLRDQFIMAALTGLCSSMRDDRIKTIYDGIQGGKIEAVAAVRIADQVMEARKRK